jgi:hypothetical protein
MVRPGMGNSPPTPLYIIRDNNIANVFIAIDVDSMRSKDQRVALVEEVLHLTAKSITK